jgi:hypothetical protein
MSARIVSFLPSAAFYVFALAAQVSGYTSSTGAAVLATLATLMLFIPGCHYGNQWHRKRKSSGRSGLDSWYFIVPCLALALIGLVGAAYGVGLRSSSSTEEKATALPNPHAEEFIKNGTLILGFNFDGSEVPLAFGGTATLTTERLRVLVDYSAYRSGWMSRVRVPIGEIKDPVKGQFVKVQLVYKVRKANGGTYDLWWGSDPAPAHPVSVPVYNEAIAPTRGRVVVLGPNGKEQHIYFELLRAPNDPNGQMRILILQGREVADWIASWEAES